MRKYIAIGAVFFVIFIVCFGIGMYMYRINNMKNTKIEPIMEIAGIKVIDECTNETEELIAMLANSTESKISPDAILIMKKYYTECEHTTKDLVEVPPEFVNLTRNELEEKYKDWEIENFSAREIVLLKEENGICTEHYVLRKEDDTVVVYYINEKGKEILKEVTSIVTNYLPQTDQINLENELRSKEKRY